MFDQFAMTSKFKVLLPIAIIIVLAIIIGISKHSPQKEDVSKMTGTNDQSQTTASDAPAPKPTGNVDDLLMAVDASVTAEDNQATSGTDQLPKDGSSDFDQTINTNEL